MQLVSIDHIPGQELEALGIVKGTIVHSKSFGKDFMAKALLSSCGAALRDDGAEIRIFADNPFVETYLTAEMKSAISDAFMSCRLNDRPAVVTIVLKSHEDPLSLEIAKKLDEQ